MSGLNDIRILNQKLCLFCNRMVSKRNLDYFTIEYNLIFDKYLSNNFIVKYFSSKSPSIDILYNSNFLLDHKTNLCYAKT